MSPLNPSSKSMSTIDYIGRNDCTTPEAVSRVSPSVVKLTYYSGDELRVDRSQRNGTIFSCKPDNGNAQFVSYILTTSDLFETPRRLEEHEEKKGASPVSKIDVYLPTDELYEGEVMACDQEINIAVIKIKSDDLLPTATLTPFSDCISLSPFGVSESHAAFCLSPYPTKVFPGDEVTIVCSSFKKTSHTLVLSGTFSIERIRHDLDSMPFLRINCQTTINGAPVINCEGDVIGISFEVFNECVAFLPVNVFFKWWKHVLTYGEICRPWMGMSITNLYALTLSQLEAVVHDCDVYDGVLIDEVICGSPAHSAGMRSDDVICQCDGRPVRSLLELTELVWDKSGEVIEAKGVRNGRHFVWKVEIEAIKAGILPDWLAKSLAENVVARKKSTKRGKNKAKDEKKSKKDKERTDLKAQNRTRDIKDRWDADSDPHAAEKLEESKKSQDLLSVPRFGAIKTGILPALAENVATESIKTEIMQANNVVARKKSTKRGKKGKNKAKGKEKAKKDKEGTGLKAKTRKRDACSDDVAADERKKGRWEMSKCSK